MTKRFRHKFLIFTSQWIFHWGVLLTLTLAVGVNLSLEHERTDKREARELLQQTSILQNLLEQKLDAIAHILSALRQPGFLLDHSNDAQHLLNVFAHSVNGLRTLTICDVEGNVLASSNTDMVGQNWMDRLSFQAIRKDNAVTSLYIRIDHKTSQSKKNIIICQSIIGKNGKFNGAVYAALDFQSFLSVLHAVVCAGDMRVALLNTTGSIFLVEAHQKNIATDIKAKIVFSKALQLRDYYSKKNDESSVDGLIDMTEDHYAFALRLVYPNRGFLNQTLYVGVVRDLKAMHEFWWHDVLLHMGVVLAIIAFSTVMLLHFKRGRDEKNKVIATATEELAQRDRFIRTVLDNIPAMVAYWNKDRRCEYANRAYREWFGKTQEQMRGIRMEPLLGERLFAENKDHISGALQGIPQMFEQDRLKADGSTGHTLARYIPDQTESGTRGFYVLVSDVTELKLVQLELEQRLQQLHVLATTDAMTGISNRRYFLEKVKKEVVQSSKNGKSLFFMMLDVDHFKSVNDTYGHDVGDMVLKALATELARNTRATDHVGRMGGEEFGALLVGIHEEKAKLLAERLREALQSACIEIRGERICYTVSIGLSLYKGGRDAPIEDMLRRADAALYKAKENGRNQVWYDGAA